MNLNQSSKNAETRLLWDLLNPQFSGYCECGNVDLKYVIAVADFHGVASLVAYNLLNSKSGILPDTYVKQLEEILFLAKIRRQFFLKEIFLISKELELFNIPYAILKGPVLSKLVYPNEHSRTYSDIDILCPIASYEKQYSILRRLGYSQYRYNDRTQLMEQTTDKDTVVKNRPKHALPFIKFINNKLEFQVDLHWSFFLVMMIIL